MVDIKQRIKQVLEEGCLLSLGTVDKDGPWVADVRYVSDDNFNIYWMSNPDFKHSKALEKDSRVAGTIDVNYKFGTPNLAVQIAGVAKKLSILRVDLAIKFVTRRGKPAPSQIAHILRKGHSWYEFKPTYIELTDEENFGFDNKQRIEF